MFSFKSTWQAKYVCYCLIVIDCIMILNTVVDRYTFSPDPQNPASWKIAGTMASETGVSMFATPRKPTM